MNKLVLKDGTKIDVVSVQENSFTMECTPEKMVEVFDLLTQSNLAKIELQDEAGHVLSIFINKDKVSCEYKENKATITLRSIDVIEIRMTELEDAFAELSEIVLGGDE